MTSSKHGVKRDWSQFSNDMLHEISKHVDSRLDLFRFRAVCQSWRSSAKLPSVSYTPIIWIPNYTEEDQKDRRATGCKLLTRTIFTIRSRKPESGSQPWLIKLEEETIRMQQIFLPNDLIEEDLPDAFHLIDPLSDGLMGRFRKVLNFSEFEVREFCRQNALVRMDGEYTTGDANAEIYVEGKFISDYNSLATNRGDDFAVMGLCSSKKELLFFRSWDDKWTKIERDVQTSFFNDIIRYKCQFYAVYDNGKTCVFDPRTLKATVVANALPNSLANSCFEDGHPEIDAYADDLRLVESNGELFLIDIFSWEQNLHAYYGGYPYPVDHCKVFKLDESQKEWIPVDSMGDRVFLVGLDCSFSLLASDFPEGKQNCVYFTYKWLFDQPSDKFCHEMGVFNLENGKFEVLSFTTYSQLFWPPPAWVTDPITH